MTKDFKRQVIKMLIPMILQNIFAAMIGSVDVIMLNSVGQTAISAGSIATQWSSIMFMFLFGSGSGAGLLAAQYFGKKNLDAIKAIEGIALKVCLLVTGIFSLGALLIPELMMRVYTTDPEIIKEGTKYLKIIWVSWIAQAFSYTYLSILRSLGRMTVSMVLNGIGFILNIILNATFIFGFFGLPKMGITGVALASSISTSIVTILGCGFVSITSKDIKMKISYMFIKSRILTVDFFKMSVPALLNDVSWGLAFSMYVAIMGRLGSDVIAANSIVSVVRQFGQTFCFAVAGVGAVVVGNLIGEGKLEEADQGGKDFMKITVITGFIGGLIVLISMPFVLKYAHISPLALHYLKWMMIINTYYIMGSAVNTTLIAGLFRSGGDTRFGLICDTIDMWGYGVLFGLFTAFVLKLPPLWVYFFLCLDEFVKWPWVLKKYKSKSWIKNITKDNVLDS